MDALITVTQGKVEDHALCDDLLRRQHYLRKAHAEEIRFCLVERAGLDKLISPVEMENRKGHSW